MNWMKVTIIIQQIVTAWGRNSLGTNSLGCRLYLICCVDEERMEVIYKMKRIAIFSILVLLISSLFYSHSPVFADSNKNYSDESLGIAKKFCLI